MIFDCIRLISIKKKKEKEMKINDLNRYNYFIFICWSCWSQWTLMKPYNSRVSMMKIYNNICSLRALVLSCKTVQKTHCGGEMFRNKNIIIVVIMIKKTRTRVKECVYVCMHLHVCSWHGDLKFSDFRRGRTFMRARVSIDVCVLYIICTMCFRFTPVSRNKITTIFPPSPESLENVPHVNANQPTIYTPIYTYTNTISVI